jgi:hypothetical protein
MRVDRFFLRVEEKTCLSMAGVTEVGQLSPCARVWLTPPGQRRTDLFHGAAEEDARGWHAGTAPLRHRRTSLSWRGRQTAPRKTDGDVAAGPPPCRTSA